VDVQKLFANATSFYVRDWIIHKFWNPLGGVLDSVDSRKFPYTCMRMFIEALLVMEQNWKEFTHMKIEKLIMGK
jgi:hypothetical protein